MGAALALETQSRRYCPEQGRFISRDPKGYFSATQEHFSFIEGPDYPDMNLYRYVYNNPLLYTDPKGTTPLAILLIAATLILRSDDAIDNQQDVINDMMERIGHDAGIRPRSPRRPGQCPAAQPPSAPPRYYRYGTPRTRVM